MAHLEQERRSYYLLIGTILLPVITLAVLGIFFLRQDKYLVEQEAQEKAKAIAEQLLKGVCVRPSTGLSGFEAS